MGPSQGTPLLTEHVDPRPPPPQVSMKGPQKMGLAATDDDDHRTPSPQKNAETLAEASCTEETMKEGSAPESLAPPAQTEKEPCPTNEQAEIDAEDKAASSSQAAGETSPGGPPPAEPPGLEGLGASSMIDGAEEQPGLHKDEETLEPPPKGKGRRALTEEELEGIPPEIRVECFTSGYQDLQEHYKIFKDQNPDLTISPQTCWYWFKKAGQIYGREIEDDDWPGHPHDIGKGTRGSQPRRRSPWDVDTIPEDGEGRAKNRANEKTKEQRGRSGGRDNNNDNYRHEWWNKLYKQDGKARKDDSAWDENSWGKREKDSEDPLTTQDPWSKGGGDRARTGKGTWAKDKGKGKGKGKGGKKRGLGSRG